MIIHLGRQRGMALVTTYRILYGAHAGDYTVVPPPPPPPPPPNNPGRALVAIALSLRFI